MSLAAALLLLCLGGPAPRCAAGAPAPVAPAADAWLAEDKLRHLLGAYAASSFAHAAARPVVDADAALLIAAGAGIVASLGKEWLDVRRGGHASLLDVVWDAAGIAAAVLVLRETR